MAVKKAQVNIQITGADTIQSLEDALASINEEIKNVDINSSAFQNLSTQAETVRTKLAQVSVSLDSVTGQRQGEAIRKMGLSLVGVFQGAAGASLIFGNKVGADFQLLIGKVAGLYSVVDGISRVTKAFSTENIAALKSLGTQWGIMGTDAKIAGMSMKTALLTSGIGILVVALGVVAANWDKITAAIKRSREEKKLAEEKKALDEQLKTQQDLLKSYDEEATAQKAINALSGNKKADAQVDLDLAKKKTAEIQAQQATLMNAQATLNLQHDKEKEKLDKIVAGNKTLNDTSKDAISFAVDLIRYSDKKLEKQKLSLKTVEDELQINLEQQIANNYNLKLLQEQADAAANLLNYQQEITDLDKNIANSENHLKILQAEEGTTVDIYEEQKKIIDLQIKKIALEAQIAGFVTEEGQQNIKNLEADKQALAIKEALFIKNLDYQTRINTLNKLYNDDLKENNTEINKANFKYDTQIQKLNEINNVLDIYNKSFDEVLKGYQTYEEFQKQTLVLGAKRQNQLEEENNFIQLVPSGLKVSMDSYEKILNYVEQLRQANIYNTGEIKSQKQALEDYNKVLEKTTSDEIIDLEKKKLGLTDEEALHKKIRYEYETQIKDIGDEISKDNLVIGVPDKVLERIAGELAIKKQQLAIEKEQLANQLIINGKVLDATIDNNVFLVKRKEIVNTYLGQLEAEKTILQNSIKSTDSAEKKAIVNDKILALDGNIVNANNELYQISNDLFKNGQDQIKAETDMSVIQGQQVENAQKKLDVEKQATAELAIQDTFFARANDWIQQNAKEIEAATELINQMFSLAIAGEQRLADKAQERIDKAQKQLDDLNKKEEKSRQKIIDLQDELKDADGERYNEILSQIAAEEAANAENGKNAEQRVKD